MMRYLILLTALPFCWNEIHAQTDSLIHSGYHIDRAKILSDSGLYDLAIKELKHIDPRDTNYVYSLAELSDLYLSNDQYPEAIATATKGLEVPSTYRSRLLISQGIAYAENKQYDKAQAVFEAGHKEYPFYPSFQLQYGKMLYARNMYTEAEKQFFEALEISPFNTTSHLHLGIIAMLRGEKVRGMMAIGLFMALNNTANKQLVMLERFVKNELTDEFTVPPSGDNPFARLDEIIRSRIAMEAEYKTKIPIDAGIVRQYQLMFDQLAGQEYSSNDPWVRIYLPVYKSMIKANVQEAFIYHILKSTSIKQVPTWTGKNEKALEQFYSVVNTAMNHIRETKTLDQQWGYTGSVSCWYGDNQRLEAIGLKNDKGKETGRWYYFYDNGTRKAEGNYDSQGTKTGIWKYYNDTGIMSSTENFDTGERQRFTDRGNLHQKYFLKNNKVEGEVFIYYDCGIVNEHLFYRDGKREGVAEVFSMYGQATERLTYLGDSIQGKYEAFYETGERRQQSNYDRGYLHGTYTSYHRNGQIYSQGEYVKGKASGPWKFYYENGQLSEIGTYKEDLTVGEFLYYHHNGKIKEKRNYNEQGELQGENHFYHDGILHYTLHNQKNRIVESTHYDQLGKVIATAKETNGALVGKGYFPTGELKSEFKYEGGKATGRWKYYERWGNLESEYEYKDNELNGKAIEYYPDKSIKSSFNYTDGKRHGYYEAFYQNGKHSMTGWYQHGELQQRWLTYHLNGKIKTDEYYLNGTLEGATYYYEPGEKLVSLTLFRHGKVIEQNNYNERGEIRSTTNANNEKMTVVTKSASGKELQKTDFLCGNIDGHQKFYLPDGKIFLDKAYKNGKQDGSYEGYAPDGSLEIFGTYRDGNAEGTWTWYYPNGTKETIGRYATDERDSSWTYYHENGNLSSISVYQYGKKQGTTKIFSPDGQLILEKLYDQGDAIAYRLPGNKDEKWTAFTGTGTIRAMYPNGKLAIEENYRNGYLHGEQKLYYPDGIVYNLRNYSYGDLEGNILINYPTGKSRVKGSYKWDEVDSRWEFYNPDGKLEKVMNHTQGYLHGSTEFFSQGKKIKEVKFWYGLPTE